MNILWLLEWIRNTTALALSDSAKTPEFVSALSVTTLAGRRKTHHNCESYGGPF
jgi:hypothetical protein